MTSPKPSGALRREVSAFPGAPGVAGGVKSADAGPVTSSVVGDNDYLAGGPKDAANAFPGAAGAAWQSWQPDDDLAGDEPTVNGQPGHVSGGIRASSPAAFYPGLGQGV